MDFHQILSAILDIAKYPEGKREKFVEDFYDYYFSILIEEMGGVDPATAQKIVFAFDHYKENPEGVNALWQEMMADQSLKEVVDRVSDKVMGELIDDITSRATEEEKQKLFALFNNPN